MEGLLKFAGVMILLYMFGWLGKRNNRRVENWFDKLAALFDRRRRDTEPEPPDPKMTETRSKLHREFKDSDELKKFVKEFNISTREWEIIELVCDGLTNKEIEEKVYASLATVKDHLYKIFRKTGVSNRVQLTNFIRNSIDEANRK